MSRAELTALGVVLAVGLGLVVSEVAPGTEESAFRRSLYPLGAGHEAPAFDLPILSSELIEGRADSLALESLRGKYVVLTFWATWCAPCRAEYPELVALKERYADLGVEVVGILKRDSPGLALGFMAEQGGATFTTLVDADHRVNNRYRVVGIPYTVLIGPDGLFQAVEFGWGGGGVRSGIEARLVELREARGI